MKRLIDRADAPLPLVAPLRVRGLKLAHPIPDILPGGRTLAGAWTETTLAPRDPPGAAVAPLRVRGLKLLGRQLAFLDVNVAPCGCADRNRVINGSLEPGPIVAPVATEMAPTAVVDAMQSLVFLVWVAAETLLRLAGGQPFTDAWAGAWAHGLLAGLTALLMSLVPWR